MSTERKFRYAQCSTVFEYGLLVLNTSCSFLKSALTLEAKYLYDNGFIKLGNDFEVDLPPIIPSRPVNIKILPPSEMPKRGKGGSLKNRIALIHSFCHIESYAIDLSWDILLRFAPSIKHRNKHKLLSNEIDQIIQSFKSNNFDMFEEEKDVKQSQEELILPIEFYQDWLRIAYVFCDTLQISLFYNKS